MAQKNLVIVESPAKAKTIGKFLGPDYEILASYGHVRDLPQKKLGVDIKNNFEPSYVASADKKKVLKELQTSAAKKDIIYIATDPDREGEAIAWHIKESIKVDESKVQRIVFNEITENAVQNAIHNGRKINTSLVDAQQARRILDRLIGYKLSPILSKKIRRGLSAGRVQSVAVKIICDREKQINAFVPEEYWNIDAILTTKDKQQIKARVFAETTEKNKITAVNETQSSEILNHLKKSTYAVSQIKKNQFQRHSQPPFITSTLQQEASRKLNWTTKRTMIIAQQLYEGLDINGESVGLITYMRTDSTRIADEALSAAKSHVIGHYGPDYFNTTVKKAPKKQNIQDAHEAIRPTYIEKSPSLLKDKLSTDHFKLYKLIWERFIASQMASAKLESTIITIQSTNGKTYFLKCSGNVMLFDGFTKLYTEGQDHPDAEENENQLPKLTENEVLSLKTVDHEQKFTQPPPRYTEATLIKELEEKGIGRPSTYAPTISIVQDRGYILKEKKALYPSELGVTVNDSLEKYFGQIIDLDFTAQMETQLDGITDGKEPWQDVITQFYTPFAELLIKADAEMEKIDNTKPTDEVCEKCNSPMVIKAGRFGEFMACSNYPACKNTKSMAPVLDVKCPLCTSDLIERRSKKGKVFYGCSSYPACTFAAWDKPILKTCEKCQGTIMFVNKFKGRETTYCATCNPRPTKAS